MEFYGIYHGIPSTSVFKKFNGIPWRIPWKIQWNSMEKYNEKKIRQMFMRNFMEFHGKIPRDSMDFHGIFHGIP
jgi:hypothetical protein